jgi:hypothetical protein
MIKTKIKIRTLPAGGPVFPVRRHFYIDKPGSVQFK